ncbi:MAG TPA: hypothetical protein VGJ86_21860, partial [Acidimicrobiales bacterium]
MAQASGVDPNGTPMTAWPAPRIRPDLYPGPAPDFPHLLVRDRVYPLHVQFAADGLRLTVGDGTPVDSVLRRLGVASLRERIPTIGYGANRSPHSLALKFSHHGRGEPVVPVFAGSLSDVDVVAAGLSSQGFVFADIVDSPGTRVDVLLALLDPEQLVAVHDSEGVGKVYDCAWLPGIAVVGTEGTLGGLAYVGRRGLFADPDGHPLAFSAITARSRRFPALSQVEMMARVIEVTGLGEQLSQLLHTEPGAVAQDLIRLLNGQWWYRHNTGDAPLGIAEEAHRTLADAMARHRIERPASSPLIATVLTRDEAYAPQAFFEEK